jgi:hypothetical protein
MILPSPKEKMKPILQVIPNGSHHIGFGHEALNYKIIHMPPPERVKPALKALIVGNVKWNFTAGEWNEAERAYVSFLETEHRS